MMLYSIIYQSHIRDLLPLQTMRQPMSNGKKMAPIKPAFWCFSKFHLNFLLFVQPPNFVPHGK